MSKAMTITISDEVYSTLIERAKRLGMSKSGYITYSLKQTFNTEEMMEKMPDIMYQLQSINNKLSENK